MVARTLLCPDYQEPFAQSCIHEYYWCACGGNGADTRKIAESHVTHIARMMQSETSIRRVVLVVFGCTCRDGSCLFRRHNTMGPKGHNAKDICDSK